MKCGSHYVESSDALDALFAAHAKALGQLRNAPKTCVSNFAKKGPDGKPIPNYADLATILDTIRGPLAANGLSVTQAFAPYSEDGTLMLVTTLGHGESGQFTRSYLPVNGKLPPQQLLSTATYLKRAAICAIVGIAAGDDDDGEVAEQAAVAAAPENDRKWLSALSLKIQRAKNADERNEHLSTAKRGLEAGHITADSFASLVVLKSALDDRDEKKAAAKESEAVTA